MTACIVDVVHQSIPVSSPTQNKAPFALLTTMRFTPPDKFPLMERHMDRLRESHSYFTLRDGLSQRVYWHQWREEDLAERMVAAMEQYEDDLYRSDWRASPSSRFGMWN